MTIPFQFGWQQMVLLLVAILGVGLLISSIMSLFVVFREIEILEDEEGRRYRHWRRRRHFRWHRGIGGLILLLVAVVFLFLASVVQTYLGLTGQIKVAHIQATKISNSGKLPMMSVDLTLFDQNGNVTSHNTYLVNGDQWELRGDILEFPSWMNVLGVHSGYKLTRLEGSYNDDDLERHAEHTVIDLNGGDDPFFKNVMAGKYPLVSAAYGQGLYLPPGQAYDVCVSQDAIKPCT